MTARAVELLSQVQQMIIDGIAINVGDNVTGGHLPQLVDDPRRRRR